MKERIAEVCSESNNAGKGVMPPRVCLYCFGCPLAALIAGITGNTYQREALSIPAEHEAEINAWLDKVEASLRE